MKRGAVLFILSALLILLLLGSGCSTSTTEDPIVGPEPIGGLIYTIDENRLLIVDGIDDVNIPRENWFEAGKRAVYFTYNENTEVVMGDLPVSADILTRGQKVAVYHEGFLAESYPEQGMALRIVVIEDTAAGEYRTDSGRFIVMVEELLVEIKISGVPDELPGRLFRLTPEAGKKLQHLELGQEEVVLFYYLPDEEADGLIFDINRLAN